MLSAASPYPPVGKVDQAAASPLFLKSLPESERIAAPYDQEVDPDFCPGLEP
jgi:hypothetical protein